MRSAPSIDTADVWAEPSNVPRIGNSAEKAADGLHAPGGDSGPTSIRFRLPTNHGRSVAKASQCGFTQSLAESSCHVRSTGIPPVRAKCSNAPATSATGRVQDAG